MSAVFVNARLSGEEFEENLLINCFCAKTKTFKNKLKTSIKVFMKKVAACFSYLLYIFRIMLVRRYRVSRALL